MIRRTPLALITLSLAVAALAIAGHARGDAAQAGPMFSLSPQDTTVALSAGTVNIAVAVDSPQNVGDFGFVLRYDPGVLTPRSAAPAPFLGSSGRQVVCPAPIIDHFGTGTVWVSCATSGAAGPASASGTTVVATVTFGLAGGDHTTVGIEHDIINTVDANLLCIANPNATPVGDEWNNTCPVQDGSVTVTGGDPSKDQGIANTPTPVVPTATPPAGGAAPVSTPVGTEAAATPTADAAQPAPATPPGAGGTGVIAPAPDTVAGAAARTGSAAGASGSPSASGAPGAGVGHFGYGPGAARQLARDGYLVIGAEAALLGLMLVAAGRRLWRNRSR